MSADSGLAYHDCDDVLKLARKALHDALHQHHATLSPENYEDCVSFLLERIIALAARYDPSLGTCSFTTLAYRLAKRRYVDFIRKTLGDSRHGHRDRGRPDVVRPNGNGGRIESVAEPGLLMEEEPVADQEMTSLLDELDGEGLSEGSRALLRTVAVGVGEGGMHASAVAAQGGYTWKEWTRGMDVLRSELEANGTVSRNGHWRFT